MTSVLDIASILEEEEVDLQRHYTEEEREALFEAYADACAADDFEEAKKLAMIMPLTPTWAKIIAEVMGKEYLRETFNITHANEEFGEGWLDEA